MAEKVFALFASWFLRWAMGSNDQKGSQVEKRRSGIKMAEKGPKKFSRFMRRGTRGGQADNGQKGSQPHTVIHNNKSTEL